MALNVFVDMDGTIADYKATSIEDFYTKGYFENLDPYNELINFLKRISKHINLYILSACITEDAKVEKREWLNRYWPELHKGVIFCECSVSKAEEAEKVLGRTLREGDILLDDHSPNCVDWEVHGGTAIKVTNGKNASGKNWKGLTLGAFRPEIMEGEKQ